MPCKSEAQRRFFYSPVGSERPLDEEIDYLYGEEAQESVRDKLQRAMDILSGESPLRQREEEYKTLLLMESRVKE